MSFLEKVHELVEAREWLTKQVGATPLALLTVGATFAFVAEELHHGMGEKSELPFWLGSVAAALLLCGLVGIVSHLLREHLGVRLLSTAPLGAVAGICGGVIGGLPFALRNSVPLLNPVAGCNNGAGLIVSLVACAATGACMGALWVTALEVGLSRALGGQYLARIVIFVLLIVAVSGAVAYVLSADLPCFQSGIRPSDVTGMCAVFSAAISASKIIDSTSGNRVRRIASASTVAILAATTWAVVRKTAYGSHEYSQDDPNEPYPSIDFAAMLVILALWHTTFLVMGELFVHGRASRPTLQQPVRTDQAPNVG